MPSLVVIVVMECSPFLFVSIRNPECSAVSGVKAAAGSAPADTIAVPPINNSRRVSLVSRTLLLLRRFWRSSNFPSCIFRRMNMRRRFGSLRLGRWPLHERFPSVREPTTGVRQILVHELSAVLIAWTDPARNLNRRIGFHYLLGIHDLCLLMALMFQRNQQMDFRQKNNRLRLGNAI